MVLVLTHALSEFLSSHNIAEFATSIAQKLGDAIAFHGST